MNLTQTIYLDGKYLRMDKNFIDSLTPGILQAKGVFETIRIYKHIPFALEKHHLRMIQGLHVLRIPFRISLDRLAKIISALLKKNCLTDARVRIQIWRNSKGIHLAVLAQPLIINLKKTYTAKISHIQQNKNYRAHVKTLYYAHFRQALQDARGHGYDEAILLNSKNEVVEGAHTNIFIVKNGYILTPRLSSGCLKGITRDLVMSCAKQLLIPLKETRLTLSQLIDADEIFLTNSILEIKPLVRIRNRNIHQQKIGAITEKISSQFQRFVIQYLKVKKA